MLPPAHRLRTPSEFREAMRSRRAGRVSSSLLVVHTYFNPTRVGQPARVGLVVSKAVGNAVMRNRVSRRLRAQVAPLVGGYPGVDVVLRAQPDAASASSSALAADLERLIALGVSKTIAAQSSAGGN